METKLSIKNLVSDGYFGYRWSFCGTDMKTDRNGCGLFIWRSNDEWNQVWGTCDFSLPKDIKRAYSKIYYHFITKELNNEYIDKDFIYDTWSDC